MKIRSWVLIFVIAYVLPTARAAEQSTDHSPFHPPQTTVEKALDIALHSSDDGKSEMTSSLLDVVTKSVEKKRNGTCAKSGEILNTLQCEGIDFERIMTCGEISHDIFLYRTASANDHEALVEVRWPQFVKAGIPDWNIGTPRWKTYRLVKDKNHWMLDGIDCGGLYKYNISVRHLQVFHLATTDPEKVLERIYRLNGDDSIDLYGFIFNYSTHNRERDKELSRLFTKDFLDRSVKEEMALIKESCGGKYPADGNPCDMIRGTNPIWCAQDNLDIYLYRTINMNAKYALVISVWPQYMPDGPAYKLVKDKGYWMLDAIYCDGYVQNKRR